MDQVIFIPVSHGILKFGGFCYITSNNSLNTKKSGKVTEVKLYAETYTIHRRKKFQFREKLDLQKSAKRGQKVTFFKVCLVIYHRKALYAYNWNTKIKIGSESYTKKIYAL